MAIEKSCDSRAPDRLDPDIFNQLPRVRDGRVHVCAIVAVVGLQFVRLAIHDKSAGVVDLLHGKLDGVVNSVTGRNERTRQGGVHSDLDDIVRFSSRRDNQRRHGDHTQQCAPHRFLLLAQPRSTVRPKCDLSSSPCSTERELAGHPMTRPPGSQFYLIRLSLDRSSHLMRAAAHPRGSTFPPSAGSTAPAGSSARTIPCFGGPDPGCSFPARRSSPPHARAEIGSPPPAAAH